MMWLFLTIALVALALVHALVALWHPRLALLLSAVSLPGILWLVGLIRSLKRHPVLIDDGEARFRLGRVRDVAVPIERIANLRTSWPAGFHKRARALNLALLSYPNILVELREPLPGRRPRWAIAHRLDEPEGFARALRARLGALRRADGPPAWFA
jgi:hypothetical protein